LYQKKFWDITRAETELRMCNILAKPFLVYGNEASVKRKEQNITGEVLR
jgi:hypothetical protein